MSGQNNDGRQEPAPKTEPERRQQEAQRVIEEYARELREVIKKLRKAFGSQ